MSMAQSDWQEEQQRADWVTGKIGEKIGQLEAEAGLVKSDVVDIRKHFWDHVTVDFSSDDDIAETYSSMKQQAELLSERERSYRHSAAALGKLRRLVQSPYFGRIDFREQSERQAERIYLGIASFLDEGDDSYLIYDWRAPISSLYYDYPPGDAAYETPLGEVKGTMELKRQYAIRDGKIRFMFDTGVTIGDELLQQVLSRTSDAQMKSIVATIQKEQNRIIRNDRSRMLIVQGSAGSGKTSAALQRVAYLLYKYRETLQADQMVLFSPNPMFNSYVSTVLPELGEENMQQTTFQEYLEQRLGSRLQLEDPFNQIEYVLTSSNDQGYEARMNGIRYKSSSEYLLSLRAYKELLERESMLFKSVRFRGKSIVTSDQIKQKFYSYDSAVRLPNRIALLRDWLLEEIRAFEKRQFNKAWVEEEMQLLSSDDYLRSYNKLRKVQRDKGMTFDDFEQEKHILARLVVNEKLKPLRARIKKLSFVDVRKLYLQLFADERLYMRLAGEGKLPQHWPEICRQTIAGLEQAELAYEDATPYLYLQELLVGFQTNTSVRHVIVDEAQDYSPFQLEFLKRLFPRAKMTALGDLNQAIYAHASALGDYEPLAALYGPDQTEMIRLTRSYRSTQEIVEFTKGMVPGGEEIVPFNRSGDKPLVTVVADRAELHERIAANIEALRTEGFDSIAVICKTAAESAQVVEAMGERLKLGLITKYTPSFEKGTLVLPAYLAKGVEFDAVIIYDGSKEQYSREQERKLFYTACTRAMHHLHIYSVGEPSPFITTLESSTYKYETVAVN